MVKRFKAPTVERALTSARAELGEGIVVLWTKERRSWLGTSEWEVTVASSASDAAAMGARDVRQQADTAPAAITSLGLASLFDSPAWAVIGIGGVGRTSLVVKLAIRLAGAGRNSRLVAADRRKLTSTSELAAYAEVLGTGFSHSIEGPAQDDVIHLIDAPALLPDQPDTSAIVRACLGARVILALDVTQRAAEMCRIVELCRSLNPAAVAFTRADVASSPSAVSEAARLIGLPCLGASVSASYGVPFRFFDELEGSAEEGGISLSNFNPNPSQRDKTCQA